ncbi:hypothetical protein EW026_g5166 [Hermanssonia centrifuga]|uniref:Cytochrome P450 n=1 Tax=Hermanssonia centrifuga TaxID=98765 RepID=A0A4S4KEY1_9APHY|nr:hypothetical protein EW026_g5166 [Hermanssonia centrifuga]
MLINLSAQDKAAQEIEAVVGKQRLPTFDDRANLPYLECIYKECLRWASVSPLTPPHRLMEDDSYDGYTLPKGSSVLCNVRAILRDEELFPDPYSFIPERYQLGPDVSPELERLMDPDTWVFGFGRRRCPGIAFASSSVWLAMVSTIACFRIERVRDKGGLEIIPERITVQGIYFHSRAV